jgi:hypothetical protein
MPGWFCMNILCLMVVVVVTMMNDDDNTIWDNVFVDQDSESIFNSF